ncbi:MAG: serine/threonine-protein kinase [Slackia sp.]|nr:serine/threonine-protein kinase [Slackia sp.]
MVGLNEEQVMHALEIDDSYRVERVLAEGRTGVTQLVTIKDSGPFVRKKIPTELANRAVWAVLPSCKSPRLPRVAATYEMPDCFVSVCDYIPGDTLEHVMASRGRLSQSEAVQILQDVCEAVSSLHNHGIVHCDVNPSNVIIAADGAHLIDLGIAQAMGQEPSRDVAVLGTWGFAAPEQYGFASVDARSDVYSMAQMLGYMLTGVVPDPGSVDFAQALADATVVSPALADAVRRGSAFEPSARYQTATEFSEAVAAACAGKGDASKGRERDVSAASSFASADAQRKHYEYLRQKAQESAQGYFAAQEKREERESRVSAAIRIGILSITIISAVAGVAMLAVGNFSRSMERYQAALSQAEQEKEGEAIDDGVLSDAEKEKIASDAALAGVQEGFDAAKDSWATGIASQSEVDAAFEALTLEESGWSVAPSGYVHYAFVLSNAEDGFKVEFPTVKIVGRDASGGVLFSQEQVLNIIMPGQTIYFGAQAGNGTAPDSVEFTVVRPHDFAVSKNATELPAFEVGNVAAVSDGFGGENFTGEVTYLGGSSPDASMGQIAVTVVLRNGAGKIVYGSTGHVGYPAEGESTTFEVVGGKLPEYATVEAYAQPW